MSESLQKRLSPKFYLIVVIGLLFFFDGLALWIAIKIDHDKTFERTNTILQKTVISLDERVRRTYNASVVILRNFAQRIQEKGLEQVISSKEEWEQFRNFAKALPDSGSLWLLDSKANLLMDSTQYPSQSMNFAEREYYIPQRDKGIDTYIGPIVKGKITHKYSFTISQRITDKRGQFLGIVLAAVETDDFTNFLRILDIGEGSTITVFRTDGALIFRQPMQDELLGTTFRNLKLFSIPIDKSPSGIFEANMVDGVQRIVAYRKVEGLPLIATTAIPVDSVLKEFHNRVKYYCLIAVIVFLILLGLSWLAYRSISREELAHRELLLARERISRINDELELRVQKRTAALEATNKEMESFAFSISHDLRAPLRAIDGYLRMILKKQGDKFDEETIRQFNVVRDNAKNMEQLIDDLLAFSRLGRQEVTKTDLDMEELIRDVWQELVTIHPKREMSLTTMKIPVALGDRALIRQVYSNLLGNAVKFTQGRNPAVIEAGFITRDEGTVYYVRDNGIGFDMKFCDKLFGVFSRLHTRAEFEGTGVGLAIVQRIINRHGGRIWAEAKVDQGATFYFTLSTSQE